MAETPPTSPSREETASKLRQLIEGAITRQEASEWAMQWVAASDPNVQDERVWDALLALGGCDGPSTDRPYLYGVEDFKIWLHELNQS